MKRAGVLFSLALCAAIASCEMPAAPDQWRPIEVNATKVEFAPGRPDVTAAGPLVFKGGLHLTSTASRFGGLSGLYVDPSGSMVALSDAGAWLSGDLVLDADRNLVGFANARMASMRDENGVAFTTKRDGDAEDIAPLLDGRFAVSFEQDHRILIYDLLVQGPEAPAQKGPPLGGREAMGANEGLEGIATLSDGRIVGVSEYAPGEAGSPFWILDPKAVQPTPIAGYTGIPPGFGAVALGRLPNGDLLRLERFYLPLIGVRMQLRLVPQAAITATPPRFDGTVVATLEPPIALDNFEALSIVANPDGTARIYMLSDDNFSSNQRTLLYAFDYQPNVAASVAAAAQASPAAPTEPAVAGEVPPPPPEFTPGPAALTPAASGAAPAAPTPAAPASAAREEPPKPAPQPRPRPPQPKPKPTPPPPEPVIAPRGPAGPPP